METKHWNTGARQIKFGTDKYHEHNTSFVNHCFYVTMYKHEDEAMQYRYIWQI